MELSKIAVRVLFCYLFLLVMMRMSGKELIAQNTPFDLVLVLVFGDIIDDMLWSEVPASQFVVAMTTLVLMRLLTAWGSQSSSAISRLVEGASTLVMQDGVPDRAGLRRLRMNLGEVGEKLREAGISRDRWGEVSRAYVEKDGMLSVTRQPWARSVPRKDAPKVRSMKR
jgi:uncharacterized membrane protein YcaP (DUF421 family)